MIVYHGSNIIVKQPHIIEPDRFLDFGKGFYTTTNRDQALNFAGKVTVRRKSGRSTVSVYEIDEQRFSSLRVLQFAAPNGEWLDFVSNNRAGIPANVARDLIIGAVANDDVYRTFILYQTGVLTREQTIEALKVKQLYNQYVFTSDAGLACLVFKEAFYGAEAF